MGMRKASISLQDLREKIYQKAKAEPEWRFWGMYTLSTPVVK
jgi:RNA-directed DNA polymerase